MVPIHLRADIAEMTFVTTSDTARPQRPCVGSPPPVKKVATSDTLV
jgi:hypothetical protein